MLQRYCLLSKFFALPLFYRLILDQLRDHQDHHLFQSTDTDTDILDLVESAIFPSMILIAGSALLCHAFYNKNPSFHYQEKPQPVLPNSRSRRVARRPKAVQLDMPTVRQRSCSPINNSIDYLSFDHPSPRHDVVVSPDAIRLQDIMKVDIQCIGWDNNSCWWDAPSEAIYWTIRNDISNALESTIEITDQRATDSFSDYLHKRRKAEPRAEEDSLWFREQLMGWREKVLGVFEREKIIAKQGIFQSASVSIHDGLILALNHPLELAGCDISHRDYVRFALSILIY
jgi:hypothetical protein